MNTATFLINSPQEIPLSEKDQKELKKELKGLKWGIIAGVLWTTLIVYSEMPRLAHFFSLAIDFQKGLLLVVFTALFLLLSWMIVVWLRNYNQDLKSSTKQVGIAVITDKQYIYDSDGSNSYLVSFKWCKPLAAEEITIDEYQLFKQIDTGNKVYLELAPHSKVLFKFLKK
ncbi:MAG: hypothetical protein R2822_03635 [Spirosomataceae bacterium]